MLIEFPGNQGQIFAVDAYAVTAVRRHKGTLAGRGAQLYEMTTVWVDNRTVFICSWKIADTLAKINEARAAGFHLWAAGYRTAAQYPWDQPGIPAEEDVRTDFAAWLIEIEAPEAKPDPAEADTDEEKVS